MPRTKQTARRATPLELYISKHQNYNYFKIERDAIILADKFGTSKNENQHIVNRWIVGSKYNYIFKGSFTADNGKREYRFQTFRYDFTTKLSGKIFIDTKDNADDYLSCMTELFVSKFDIKFNDEDHCFEFYKRR